METVLVGDIGGTHARFARATSEGLHDVRVFQCSEHDSFEHLVQRYTSTLHTRPDAACFAVAGPVGGGEVRWTNLSWTLEPAGLSQRLGLHRVQIINDFEAVAWSLGALRDEHLLAIGGGTPRPRAPRVAIGPGTGLGLAAWLPSGSMGVVLPTEGGHATLGPVEPREAAVLATFGPGRLHAEAVLSGSGLARLADGVRMVDGRAAAPRTPEAIVTSALEAHDAADVEAALLFLRMLGRFAGDAALMLGARGGVYIASSIVQSMLPLLHASDIRLAFDDKPTMASYIQAVPLWLITRQHPGLVGAAVVAGVVPSA